MQQKPKEILAAGWEQDVLALCCEAVLEVLGRQPQLFAQLDALCCLARESLRGGEE